MPQWQPTRHNGQHASTEYINTGSLEPTSRTSRTTHLIPLVSRQYEQVLHRHTRTAHYQLCSPQSSPSDQPLSTTNPLGTPPVNIY